MDTKCFNEKIKKLREIILKPENFEEAITLSLELHAIVHCSEVSNGSEATFADKLIDGLEEKCFREAINKSGKTIAYDLWHITRIEDITANILIDNSQQVFEAHGYQEKLEVNIKDTGNSMTSEEILAFSSKVNFDKLLEYRLEVGKRTRTILENLKAEDMKRKFTKEAQCRIFTEGGVLDTEASAWLVDFWGRKNTAGIILMPLTRHQLVHINEATEAKIKYEKRVKKLKK